MNSRLLTAATVLAAGLWLLVGPSQAFAQCEVDKVTASDGNANAGDQFGFSVDVNGDFAVVGADEGDGGGQGEANTGAAFLLRRDGLNWIELKQLVASDGSNGDEFGTSVAIGSGADLVVVGAPKATGRNTIIDAGAVYVFRRYQDSFPCRDEQVCADVELTTCTNDVCEGLTWAVEAKLLAPDPKIGDGFGNAVAISGNVVVVGERKSDAVSNPDSGDSGAAYVFRRYENSFPCEVNSDCQRSDVGLSVCDQDRGVCEGLAWVGEGQLLASDAAVLEFFGTSVAVDGDRLVVGAPSFNGSGAAYVFKYDGSAWNETQKLVGSDSQDTDGYGQAVDLHENLLVVTALSADGVAQNTGKAYMYRLIGDTYGDEQILVVGNAEASDRLGRSASLHGDFLLLGARDTDRPGRTAGSAYLFRFDGTNWNEAKEFQGSDTLGADRFGHSVALSETYAIIGAYKHDDDGPGDNDGGADSGSAYIFAIGLGRDCNGNGEPDDCEVIDETVPDDNGNGTPDGCECQSPDDCAGGDECSTAICNQDSLCELTVNPGTCRINGACFNDGDPNGDNPCQVCNASVDDDAFSPVAGSPACDDDGNDCTLDVCASGFCGHQALDEGTACGDQTDTECNPADTCDASGVCVVDLAPDGRSCTPDVPDDNECKEPVCDAGSCVANGVQDNRLCGDKDTVPETACDKWDRCDTSGVCQANFEPSSTSCDDGVFCNGDEDSCLAGACDSHAGAPCTGEGQTCDEGDRICGCDASVADVCDDGDVCTNDACVSLRCENADITNCCVVTEDCAQSGGVCEEIVCINNECTLQNKDFGVACDDQATDTDCDKPDICDGVGNCNDNFVAPDTSCGVAEVGGADTFDPDCDMANTCNAFGKCQANHVTDGTACPDDKLCNGSETCVSGVCTSASAPCDPFPCKEGPGEGEFTCLCVNSDDCPSLECTTDTCNAEGECDRVINADRCLIDAECATDGAVNPSNECEVCDTAQGTTVWSHAEDQTACDDDENDCTNDVCSAGECEHPDLANDTECTDDELVCTGKETCQSGECSSSGDPCTSQGLVCIEALSSVDDLACGCDDDGDCDDGVFCNGAETCADGVCIIPDTDPCTGGRDCDETNNECDCATAAHCDDGLFCNGAETCSSGACQSGNSACPSGQTCDESLNRCNECNTGADCDDGDNCTVDACPNGTCSHTLQPGCRDADADGVDDGLDVCSDTPFGAVVDGVGCSCSQLDGDDDDVDDCLDDCPDTSAAERATVDAFGCACGQLDDDGDDVDNCSDVCPETEDAAVVDAEGCSNAERDDDRDGVLNTRDLCPGTPATEEVNRQGCSESQFDSDGDGVADGEDDCPDTPAGTEVEDDGCSLAPAGSGDVPGDGAVDVPGDGTGDGTGTGDGDTTDSGDPAAGQPIPGTGTDCASGGLCGSMGLLNLAFIFFGLVSMRVSYRRRRASR